MATKNYTPLRNYVRDQDILGWSDVDTVLRWMQDNDQSDDLVDIIVGLLKQQLNKKDRILNQARVWVPTLFDNAMANSQDIKPTKGKVVKATTQDEQNLYNRLTAYYLLDMEIPAYDLEMAREIIPNRTRPFVFYAPALEWLAEEYDIEFKEDKK